MDSKYDKPDDKAEQPAAVRLVPAGGADAAAGAAGGDAIIEAWEQWQTFEQDVLFKGWLHCFDKWNIVTPAQWNISGPISLELANTNVEFEFESLSPR